MPHGSRKHWQENNSFPNLKRSIASREKKKKGGGRRGNNVHLDSLILPSGSDPTILGMFESNRFVQRQKESLKINSELEIGKKHVRPSPVGWDEDEHGLLQGRHHSSPIPVTSTETWLTLQMYMAHICSYIHTYWEKAAEEAPAVTCALQTLILLHFSCFEPCVCLGPRRKTKRHVYT